MKKYALLFSVIIILISLTSCSYFKRSSDTKLIYIVEKKSVNVTEKLSPYSKVIGKLHKGDTIISTGFLIGSVPFIYKGSLGYVSDKDVKGVRIADKTKVSNMQLSKTGTFFRDLLNNYLNWRRGIFWLIALASVLLTWAFVAIGKSLEDRYYYNSGYGGDSYNKLPFFTAFVGGLFSVAYMFWREDVLQAFFVTEFWWMPKGKGWLHWYLWSASLLGVLSILFYWLRDLYYYRLRSLFTIIFYALTAVIGFVAGLFLGVVGVVIGIALLVMYIGGSFAEGSGSYGRSGGGMPSSSGKSIDDIERARFIRDRAEESEASRKLAALKSEIEWDNMKMKDD